MEAIPFQKEKHWSQIQAWAEGHGKKGECSELLPKTGRIVEGVAAFFLYQTDSSLGLLENLISNPFANILTRSRAIDACIQFLLEDARRLGIHYVMASSSLRSIPKRAKRHGFQIQTQNYQMMTMRLI